MQGTYIVTRDNEIASSVPDKQLASLSARTLRLESSLREVAPQRDPLDRDRASTLTGTSPLAGMSLKDKRYHHTSKDFKELPVTLGGRLDNSIPHVGEQSNLLASSDASYDKARPGDLQKSRFSPDIGSSDTGAILSSSLLTLSWPSLLHYVLSARTRLM